MSPDYQHCNQDQLRQSWPRPECIEAETSQRTWSQDQDQGTIGTCKPLALLKLIWKIRIRMKHSVDTWKFIFIHLFHRHICSVCVCHYECVKKHCGGTFYILGNLYSTLLFHVLPSSMETTVKYSMCQAIFADWVKMWSIQRWDRHSEV